MKALIQRVSSASVSVKDKVYGEIALGLLLFLGVERDDSQETADKLLHKLINYRVFPDTQGKMNLSLKDIQAELLIVSQFTLAADTQKGLRPSFSTAAGPECAEELYEYFIESALTEGISVETGIFGADMQVSLLNDGPVTFLLEV